MRIAIIDCGAGNLHSVRKAFVHVAEPLGAVVEVTTTPEALQKASHIVLPGVGAYADCMQGLLRHEGLREALEARVLEQGVPFFGICVGMQMLFERGHEYGVTEGLGWFKGEVRKLAPVDANLRIPHMGWNTLDLHAPTHPVFAGLLESPTAAGASVKTNIHAYFVHSYHATEVMPQDVLATVDYGGQVVACIGRANIVATQFHPEKSQQTGLRMIENFVRM